MLIPTRPGPGTSTNIVRAQRDEFGRSSVSLRSWGFAVFIALACAGCAHSNLVGTLLANQRPVVAFSRTPALSQETSSYSCEISWTGSDVDGRVVSFRYAIDPLSSASAETLWTSTTANRGTFRFTADSIVAGGGRRFHTFVIQAVDDGGAKSAPEHVSFDATTIAPSIQLSSPRPSRLLTAQLTSSFRARWEAQDPDGVTSRSPAHILYRVFGPSSAPSYDAIRADPETLTAFAPSFAGWDSLPGTATSVALRDLTPGESYILAVVAIDEAGAWSPTFSLDMNVLQFFVDATPGGGPKVTLSNASFTYAFAAGGIQNDPDSWPAVDFAAGVPMVLGWSARADAGTFIRGMRWAVDIASLTDETPRDDERTDINRWSRWTTGPSILIEGLDPKPGTSSSRHLVYVEVEDDIGQLSMVGVRATVVRPVFDRPLLVVDDTFFRLDRLDATGCTAPPSLAWPTAAELDTFLFAVGGVPWRCYAPGTLSPRGLLAGYEFDTLGTHTLRVVDFNLSFLGRYRNIIWMVDGSSASSNDGVFNTTAQPMPMFRYLAQPGVFNPLATWIQQGGRLWLLGGGASYGSLRDFDVPGTPSNRFSNSEGELTQGRFMFDHAHWRSETETFFSRRAQRSERALADGPGEPDYSLLPPLLQEKTAATDPLPPLRTASNFYSNSHYAEYLVAPNAILEAPREDPEGPLSAALDTLYETQGGLSGTGHPVMTSYHGSDNGGIVFSGFPLWYFQRSQSIQLVDFVLQRMWGLTRREVPR